MYGGLRAREGTNNVVHLGVASLREACAAPQPPRSTLDPVPDGATPFGVALSGGGFRATLSGIGILRGLATAGRLADVRHASSVSGGSIANGLFANAWSKLKDSDFSIDVFDDEITNPALDLISDHSLAKELISGLWRTLLPGYNRTDLLAHLLDKHLFDGRKLEDLPEGCWFDFNTTNLTVAARYLFNRDLIGDYISGHVPTRGTGIKLAHGVSVSCAVPGVFAPMKQKKPALPCQEQAGTPVLVDGGVFDNLGDDELRIRPELPRLFCIVGNAGGIFKSGSRIDSLPIIGSLKESNDVMYQQVSAVRSEWLYQQFTDGNPDTLKGIVFSLRTLMPPDSKLSPQQVEALAEFRAQDPEVSEDGREELAAYATTFDRVPRDIAERLIKRGEWLTGATLALFPPD